MNNIYDKIKKAKIISINSLCILTPISLVFFLSNMLNLGLFTLYIDGIGVLILKMSDLALKNKCNSNNKAMKDNTDLINSEETKTIKVETKEKNIDYTFISEDYTVMSTNETIFNKMQEELDDYILDRPIILDSSSNIDKTKEKQNIKVLKKTLK